MPRRGVAVTPYRYLLSVPKVIIRAREDLLPRLPLRVPSQPPCYPSTTIISIVTNTLSSLGRSTSFRNLPLLQRKLVPGSAYYVLF